MPLVVIGLIRLVCRPLNCISNFLKASDPASGFPSRAQTETQAPKASRSLIKIRWPCFARTAQVIQLKHSPHNLLLRKESLLYIGLLFSVLSVSVRGQVYPWPR